MFDQDDDFLTNSKEACTRKDSVNLHIPLLPTLEFEPDANLAAQGWQRRFMADPVRVQEAVRVYTELGFDVHIESIKPTELSEICGDCRLVTCQAYSTVYTRKRSERNNEHKQK